MTEIKLTSDELRLMSLFQSITSATARDCIVDDRMERVIFVVNKGQMGLAIGKGGSTIKQLQNVVAKKVELVEYSDDPVEFIRNMLNAEMVGDVPHRDMGSHETAGVYDRPQRRCRDAEGQHIFGMGVRDRVNVKARFTDRAVNKSFEIQGATVVADRIAVSGRVACPRL